MSGGQFLWNAIAICDMSKTSWKKGKLRMKEDLVNLQRTICSIWCTGGIPPKFPRERSSEKSSIRKESVRRNLSRICFDRGEKLEGRHSDC